MATRSSLKFFKFRAWLDTFLPARWMNPRCAWNYFKHVKLRSITSLWRPLENEICATFFVSSTDNESIGRVQFEFEFPKVLSYKFLHIQSVCRTEGFGSLLLKGEHRSTCLVAGRGHRRMAVSVTFARTLVAALPGHSWVPPAENKQKTKRQASQLVLCSEWAPKIKKHCEHIFHLTVVTTCNSGKS